MEDTSRTCVAHFEANGIDNGEYKEGWEKFLLKKKDDPLPPPPKNLHR